MTQSKCLIQEIKGYSYPWNLLKRELFLPDYHIENFWSHSSCFLFKILETWSLWTAFEQTNLWLLLFWFVSFGFGWVTWLSNIFKADVRGKIITLNFFKKKMVVIPTGIYIRAYIFDKWRWNSLRNHIFHCFCDLGKHFLWKILKSILNKLNLRSFDMQIEKFSIPWLVNSHQ